MLLLVPSIVCAADLQSSNLTVVMNYNNAPLSGIDVETCLVANATADVNGTVTFTATQAFAGANADLTTLTTDEANVALAARLDSYASANNITRSAQVTGSGGETTFSNLPAGLYLVAQKNGASSEYIIAPYLVMVPTTGTARNSWNYNVVSYPKTEPTKIDINTGSVSVYKIWKGTSTTPSSVLMQLYENGSPYGEAVALNDGNFWSYTWTKLDPKATWTVDETAVPAGYVKTVSGNATTGFIITNTKSGTTIPTVTPTTIPASSGSTSQSGGGGSYSSTTPKTGDASMRSFLIRLGIACSIAALALIGVLNHKRLARAFARK